MTGLESITKKILEDAENKANAIIENAKSRAKEIAEGARWDIAQKKEQAEQAARQNAELRAQRIIAAAQLEAKKDYLAAKQALIDEVFKKAVSSLASLDDSEYDELIKKMSRKVSGEVILLPRDKEKGTGGGFIVRNGNVEYNFSFEALAKAAKEKLENEIVSTLFG